MRIHHVETTHVILKTLAVDLKPVNYQKTNPKKKQQLYIHTANIIKHTNDLLHKWKHHTLSLWIHSIKPVVQLYIARNLCAHETKDTRAMWHCGEIYQRTIIMLFAFPISSTHTQTPSEYNNTNCFPTTPKSPKFSHLYTQKQQQKSRTVRHAMRAC